MAPELLRGSVRVAHICVPLLALFASASLRALLRLQLTTAKGFQAQFRPGHRYSNVL